MQNQYTYYPWNTAIHGGKLQQIYTTRGTTPLQNFQYAYDSNANITTIQDYIVGSPQTQSFGYDNLDRLTSAGASGGTQGNYTPEGYTYDAATGNLATKAGSSYNYGPQSAECSLPGLDKAHAAVSAGSSKFYCYDQNGNMVRRKINDVIYTLTYDSENHMTGYSGGGVSAGFVYDGDGRRVQSTVSGVTRSIYDAYGRLHQTIDARGHATTFGYDLLGRQVSVTDALGNITTTAYDALGNRIAFTDALGRTTTYTYDALGRLVQVTSPDGSTTTTAYDALGRRKASTNALGRVTIYVYDSLGRLLCETVPLISITSYSYDAVGNRLTIIDPNGYTTRTAYDALNRPIAVTDPLSRTTTTTYNSLGQVIAVTNALGEATQRAYDALGRLASVSDPLGNTTQYTFDAAGNNTDIRDANGVVAHFVYDDLNRLVETIANYRPGFADNAYTNVHTRYTYDANGNRLEVRRVGATSAQDVVHLFTYNELDRLASVQDAQGNLTTYAYNAVGQRRLKTNAAGAVTHYYYDQLDRLASIIYPDGQVSFGYNALGLRTAMTDTLGLTTWDYDVMGRTLTVTHPLSGTVGYSYDPAGNRTSLVYPDGKQVQYFYDAAGQLVQVTDWEGQVLHYNYDAAGRLAGTALPNGVSSWYAYDAAGRLVGLTHLRPEKPGWSFQYGYDGVGNRVAITETISAQWSFAAQTLETIVDGLTIHYTYDPLRQLVGAVYSSGESFGYEYDWAGNVLTYTQYLAGLEVATTYTYQGDQLATAKAGNSPTTWHYAFDVEGRLVEVTPDGSAGNGARRYSYNAAGYLVEVESYNGTGYQPQAEMAYNGLGQRLEMTAYAGGLSLSTQYILDSERGATPLAATAGGDSTYYLYGLGAVAERAAAWNYYLHDGPGSLRKVVDAQANITLERSYTPWGDVLTQSGTIDPAQGYLGGWVDAVTGLIYVGNGQYYDPKTGRFLTRDAQPGKFNPYVPSSDPTGLLVGPLALLVLARGKKGRKGSRKNYEINPDRYIVLLVILSVMLFILTSCGPLIPPPEDYPGGNPPTIPTDGDQSQYCGADRSSECWEMIYTLQNEYPYLDLESEVKPDGGYWWNLEEVQLIYNQELQSLDGAVSGRFAQVFAHGEIPVQRVRTLGAAPTGDACGKANSGQPIKVYNQMYWKGYCEGTFVHEIAHKWDEKEDYKLSEKFETFIGASTNDGVYDPGGEPPSLYSPESITRVEDFAQSFAEYSFPQYFLQKGSQVVEGTKRWEYINTLVITGEPPVINACGAGYPDL